MEDEKKAEVRAWAFCAEEFAEAVKLAKLAAPKNTRLPILEGALLSVDADGNATLRATSLDVGVERRIRLEAAEGGPEGALWLPIKPLDAAVKAIIKGAKKGRSAGSVRFEWEPGSNKLAFSRVPAPGEAPSVTQLRSPSGLPEEYPDPFARLESPAHHLDGLAFGEALKFVGKFAATDSDRREALRGPRIEANAEGARIVATNGICLAARSILADASDGAPDVAASLPREFAKLAAEVWNKTRPGVPKLRLSRGEGYGDGRLSLEDAGSLVWCEPLGGTWPALAGIVPSEWRWRATLEKNDLLQALKRAKAVLRGAGDDERAVALGPDADGHLCLRACHGGVAFSERLGDSPGSRQFPGAPTRDYATLPGAPAIEFRPDHLETLLKGESGANVTLCWNNPDVSRLIRVGAGGSADGDVLAVNGRALQGVFEAEPSTSAPRVGEGALVDAFLSFEPTTPEEIERQVEDFAEEVVAGLGSYYSEAARLIRVGRFDAVNLRKDASFLKTETGRAKKLARADEYERDGLEAGKALFRKELEEAAEFDALRYVPAGCYDFIVGRLERRVGAFARLPAGAAVGFGSMRYTAGGE